MLDKARDIANRLKTSGASNVYMVGGCVRDKLLGIDSKDIDIECYGLSYPQIVDALKDSRHRLDLVGEQFAVLKVDNEIDVSIPRRENKVGIGHQAFDVEADPTMTVEEAATRRDFTINAISMDFDGNIVDPFNGAHDLHRGVLKHIGPAFAEDPLRVLRGMQFAARFNLISDDDTAKLCRHLKVEFHSISKERIWIEWEKWATKGVHPSQGLEFLQATEWIEFFPALENLVDLPQDPEWHPEGCAFTHTKWVCDAAAIVADREQLNKQDRTILLLAALLHDVGKATTSDFIDGRWRSPEHDKAGVEPSIEFLKSIKAPNVFIDHVPTLVSEHMVHINFNHELPSERVVRRLCNRLKPTNIRQLVRLVEADHSGRPPLPKASPMEAWLQIADQLAVADAAPKPILMGRHLINLGVTPGPDMGNILDRAFEAQLDGSFEDEAAAVQWYKENYDADNESS